MNVPGGTVVRSVIHLYYSYPLMGMSDEGKNLCNLVYVKLGGAPSHLVFIYIQKVGMRESLHQSGAEITTEARA